MLLSNLVFLSFIVKGLAICQLRGVITTQKVLFYSSLLTPLNTFEQQLLPFNSIGTLRTFQAFLISLWQVLVFLISFSSLKRAKNEGNFVQSMAKQDEAQAHEESKLWKASQPLPNQSSMQGRKSEKKSNIRKFCMLFMTNWCLS